MDILFSNGVDELKIQLPPGPSAPDDWFDAPVQLRIGSLEYGYLGGFQWRDFHDISRRLDDLLEKGEPLEFDCTERHLRFTVKKHDSLGHFCININIEQSPTVITTSFVLEYGDVERVISR